MTCGQQFRWNALPVRAPVSEPSKLLWPVLGVLFDEPCMQYRRFGAFQTCLRYYLEELFYNEAQLRRFLTQGVPDKAPADMALELYHCCGDIPIDVCTKVVQYALPSGGAPVPTRKPDKQDPSTDPRRYLDQQARRALLRRNLNRSGRALQPLPSISEDDSNVFSTEIMSDSSQQLSSELSMEIDHGSAHGRQSDTRTGDAATERIDYVCGRKRHAGSPRATNGGKSRYTFFTAWSKLIED